jgi:hypothetical protein
LLALLALLAYDELVNLGFIDVVNYISCSLTNMQEKIAYILYPNNLEEINKIRKMVMSLFGSIINKQID